GGVDEVGDIGPQRLGDRGQERDRSFSLAVLDRRDLRGRTPHFLPQLVQRQTPLFAKKSDSSADAQSIRLLLAALDFRFDADAGRSSRFCVPVHVRAHQYDRSANFLEPEISRLFIRKSPTTALAAPTEEKHQPRRTRTEDQELKPPREEPSPILRHPTTTEPPRPPGREPRGTPSPR